MVNHPGMHEHVEDWLRHLLRMLSEGVTLPASQTSRLSTPARLQRTHEHHRGPAS